MQVSYADPIFSRISRPDLPAKICLASSFPLHAIASALTPSFTDILHPRRSPPDWDTTTPLTIRYPTIHPDVRSRCANVHASMRTRAPHKNAHRTAPLCSGLHQREGVVIKHLSARTCRTRRALMHGQRRAHATGHAWPHAEVREHASAQVAGTSPDRLGV